MIDYEDVTSALTRLWKGKTKAIRLYRDGGRSATLVKDDLTKHYDLKPLKDPSCRYPWDDEIDGWEITLEGKYPFDFDDMEEIK